MRKVISWLAIPLIFVAGAAGAQILSAPTPDPMVEGAAAAPQAVLSPLAPTALPAAAPSAYLPVLDSPRLAPIALKTLTHETVRIKKRAAPSAAVALRRIFDAGGRFQAGRSPLPLGGLSSGLGILPITGERHPQPGARFGPRPLLASEIRGPRLTIRHGLPTNRRGLPRWLAEAWHALSPQRPLPLLGNPVTEAEFEAAIRSHIRQNPALYGNFDPNALKTTGAAKVEGRAGLQDTVYVHFKQQVGPDKLEVDGSFLTFTIQSANGRPSILSISGQLFPNLDVATRGGRSLEELERLAAAGLGIPPESAGPLKEMRRRVMHVGGRWRAVQTFMAKKTPIEVAVDLNTGEAFPWDPRRTAVEGTVSGRAMLADPTPEGDTLSRLPLSDLVVQGPTGKATTDPQGRFSLADENNQPVRVSAALSGSYGYVSDRQGADLKLAQSAAPGQTVELVFNPQGDEENPTAQATAFYLVNWTLNYVKSLGVWNEAFNTPLEIIVNEDEDCNAHFIPGSLTFGHSNERCRNSALPGVVPHETGHAIDYVMGGGQIKDDAGSEGWGDIVEMYLRRTPLVGGGLFKSGPLQAFLRTGKNTYQYKEGDEAHKKGQAWMGFAWKLFENLSATLGPEAAWTLAENLVIPVFNASPADILSAMHEVVLRDLDATGHAPHFAQMQAAAQAHGITLRAPAAGAQGPVARLTTAILGRLR